MVRSEGGKKARARGREELKCSGRAEESVGDGGVSEEWWILKMILLPSKEKELEMETHT